MERFLGSARGASEPPGAPPRLPRRRGDTSHALAYGLCADPLGAGEQGGRFEQPCQAIPSKSQPPSCNRFDAWFPAASAPRPPPPPENAPPWTPWPSKQLPWRSCAACRASARRGLLPFMWKHLWLLRKTAAALALPWSAGSSRRRRTELPDRVGAPLAQARRKRRGPAKFCWPTNCGGQPASTN